MNSRPLLASLLCASLASLTPLVAHAQLPPAGVSAVMVSLASQDAEPVVTSVLGLRSEDKQAAERLTTSLRSAFAEREMTGGQELTLEEVILTLDCESEADTACMTEAGGALEAQKLVYGSLEKSGGSYVVEISVLDVTTGQVEAQGTLPFDKEALSASNVDATAVEVVNSLYPQAGAGPIAVAPTPGDVEVEPSESTEEAPPASDLVWGPYKPRPTWKKAGLGISATLAVLGLATSVTGYAIYKGRFEGRVSDAIDRNMDGGGDDTLTYCKRIEREERNAERDDAGELVVTDPARSRSCEWFLAGRRTNLVGTGVAVVAGAATVVFLVLQFVHRDESKKSSARKRTFRLSGGPSQGGAMVGGVGRF